MPLRWVRIPALALLNNNMGMERMKIKHIISCGFVFLIIMSSGCITGNQSQEVTLNETTFEEVGESSTPIKPIRPSIECDKIGSRHTRIEIWGEDEYCLYDSSPCNEPKPPLEELNKIKTKMLETISEDYFEEHFDLENVKMTVFYSKYKDPTSCKTFRIDTRFIFEIGEYNFPYRVSLAGLTFEHIIPPREIKYAINRSEFLNKAGECSGEIGEYNTPSAIGGIVDSDGEFYINPYDNNFTLFGLRITNVNTSTYKNFKMNLENGESECYESYGVPVF